MLSIWEKESFTRYDYVVIGSGITGLSTAISLKEKHPASTVLVLERGLLPSGASTRNAGFACIGTLSEKMHDLQLMGEEQLLQLMIKRWEGLQLLRQRLGDKNMDFEACGGYELILDKSRFNPDALSYLNRLLHPYFKQDVYQYVPERIQRFGFNPELVQGLVLNVMDGQLHSGKMMQGLLSLARSKDIECRTGAEVMSLQDNGHGVSLDLQHQVLSTRFTIEAKKVAVCTNAFTQKLLPDIQVQPGRGQVLLTSPIEGLPFSGTFNFDEGYYYFRNLGNRVLFGGGRNLDFAAENTTDFGLTNQVQNQLEYYLHEVILPGKSFEITDRWAGIMAFGENKLPELRAYSSHIFIGVKLNGMGVALGSRIGEELANLLLEG